LPEWSAQTLPAEAREKHETQEGTWALLTVRAGALRFISLSAAGEELSSRILEATSEPQLIAPGAWHRVEPVDEALRCQVSFLCEPSRYLEKKYQLTAPHSEVRALLPSLLTAEGRTVLDLGCGRGRNSFFLAEQGFSVTALDRSEPSISALREIQQAEGVEFPARVYDINEAALAGVLSGGAVDHVICTVVFQFLDPTRVPAIIADMQAVTRPGGLHLIVAPVTSAQLPCPIDFPFVFEPGELRDAYRTWDVLRYDETPGEFHRRDERGVPFKALFATLVARRR
jgi:tellurite methyltransferase